MTDTITSQNIDLSSWDILYKWKPYATRPKGWPRLRWEDDVRNDLRKMGVKNWKQRVQERKQWKEIIEQAKTHKEL
jgi:hypothetical protein